jgi:hypothetical protein
MVWIGWGGIQFTVQEPKDLSFVFFEEAHGVVFRVTLKIDNAKLIRTDGQVDAGLRALDKNG